MSIKDWNPEPIIGYKPQTTFYMDFGIAEQFGIDAVRETYARAFAEWKTNVVYLTELVMVLNWKIWEHYETNEPLAAVYQELWEKADDYAITNLKGDDLAYFWQTTD